MSQCQVGSMGQIEEIRSAQKFNLMIFNFSKNSQFTTRINMEGHVLPVINKVKLLGTIITDDLKWDDNTASIIKKANGRLLLLRKAAEYTKSKEDLKTIYISYIRSMLEQSSVIWHSTLTKENQLDLERVQKNALRIIQGDKYEGYKITLNELQMESLFTRREELALRFAENCVKNEKTKELFPLRKKKHTIKTRKVKKYEETRTRTERFKRSTVPFLQRLMNQHEETN